MRESNRIAEEAAQWVVRLEEDNTPQQRAALVEWLRHSPSHVQEFLVTEAAYSTLDGVDARRRIPVNELLKQSSENVVALQDVHCEPKARPRKRFLAAAAAGVVALALILWLATSSNLAGTETYATQVGEQRSIQLQDSSVIHLNTKSRITVDYSQERREIHLLDGEALFVVAGDSARPFRVMAGSTVVQAVGTQFDVYRGKDRTTVAVVEGRVQVFARQKGMLAAVNSRAAPATLNAGEEARVTPGRIVKRTTPNRADTLAWRQRQMVFRSDALADIAEQFNRYNRTQIRVADPAVAARRLSGVVSVDDLDSLLGFLNGDRDLTFDHDVTAGRITISKK